MKWCRSLLFVPGQKLDWMLKAGKYGADGLMLDIEDSVPMNQKEEARRAVTQAIKSLKGSGLALFVRANAWNTGDLLLDVLAVVQAGLDGIMLSKAAEPSEVRALDLVLSSQERALGLPLGEIEIIPALEGAGALRSTYEFCTASPRVRRIAGVGVIAPGGDVNRDVGYEWTEEGLETLYISSKMVLESRAAGIENILTGVVTTIHDLGAVGRGLARARQLGANGGLVIHPSHVSVANEVFSPTESAIAEARDLLWALHSAVIRGDSATTFKGKMVDLAHARSSVTLLERAKSVGLKVDEYPHIDT